jgi:transcription initiation factor TFIIE subunit beta
MRLEDIAIVTNTPLTTDSGLLEKFKHHDRVAYDPKTDLYSYKVRQRLGRLLHVLSNACILSTTIMSALSLLFLLRFNGIPVRVVVLLYEHSKTRGKKHHKRLKNSKRRVKSLLRGPQKMVSCGWCSIMRSKATTKAPLRSRKAKIPYVYCGTQHLTVSTEFMDLWHSLKVPNETDLLKDLASGTSGSLLRILILTMRNRGITSHSC